MKIPDTSKAKFKVVLDLGKGELGDPENPDRIAREATALAEGTYKLWNTRAPAILRRAAEKLEREERERRI
jgi:hypothetical protein